MRKIYLSFLTIGLLMSVLTVYGQKHILFMGRGAADNLTEYQSDADLIDSLKAWGFKVSYMPNSTYSAGVDVTVFDTIDGCFINETVDSKAMKDFGTTHDYPVPVICLEGYVVSNTNDRWAWIADAAELFQAADNGGTEDDQVIVIQDNKHYITEIFRANEEVQWSGATEEADVKGNRPVSITESVVNFSSSLATLKSHADQADFFTLLTVDEMGAKGNKVVYWGINHLGLNGADQTKNLGTPDFFTIVKRAAEWAYDAIPPDAVNKLEQDTYELVSYPNPATDKVTVQFRAINGQNAMVSLHNITGAQMNDIYSQTTVDGRNYIEIDLNKYTQGVYIIKLQLEQNVVYSKLVIE